MVKSRNAEQFACLAEAEGDGFVLRTGYVLAGRMVVTRQHGYRSGKDRMVARTGEKLGVNARGVMVNDGTAPDRANAVPSGDQ